MKELLLNKKKQFAIYIIACFLPVVDSLIRMGLFGMMFEVLDKKDIILFRWIVILAIGASVLAGGLHIASRLMRIGFMRDILLEVRKRAFDKILSISYKDFSKQSKEVYMSHLINDVNTFENNFFLNLLNVIYMGGLYSVCLIILYVVDFKLGIVMTGISIGMFFFARLFSNKTESLQEQVSEQNEHFTVDVANTFNGLEILKLNNIEDKFLDKSLEAINKVEKRKVAFNIYSEQQRSLMMFASYIILVGVVVYVGIKMANGGNLGIQMITVQLCSSLIFPLVEILPRFNVIKSSKRIFDKITQKEGCSVNENKEGLTFDFNQVIEVKDLSFSYEAGKILEEAQFTIEAGKKYLIKGVSGAGKSTLMKLLSMIYDDYEGSIVVDGKDYKAIGESDFNNQVAFVYQDVFLFEDTIHNNISLYKDIPTQKVLEAAHKAGLDDLLEGKDGLETMLLENGKNLSGGQRQRISIARALAKNAKILFVDEGTSALNEEMGRKIEQELLGLDCTVVAISHRYYEGITQEYDYVLELKNRKVHTYSAKDYFGEVVVC
ncbi:ABC transporter ATP-binding protein [Zhenhengia yiwuensis]|uniref:ABC transporter ATP-binding protein n=1 Tax=Zhenhengia yiwuensis TaxID=2763666 RepID=UPI001B66D325|nr:ABC transporter ATP-binding protein [Zhenhengia yiwuensis]MBP3911800.1 ABC transporter ATP-binding protein [Niameybacter sp.]MDY3366582.1 ABC transporter ATP-binding protein [Zhenhengia yiwuensis]